MSPLFQRRGVVEPGALRHHAGQGRIAEITSRPRQSLRLSERRFVRASREGIKRVDSGHLNSGNACIELASRACDHAARRRENSSELVRPHALFLKSLQTFRDHALSRRPNMAKYLLVSFKTCPWVQTGGDRAAARKATDFEFPPHSSPTTGPDWFLAISARTRKVPVLRIDDFRIAVRIETPSPSIWTRRFRRDCIPRTRSRRAHEPGLDRLCCRASPRQVTGCAYADSEADYRKAVADIPVAFRAAGEGAGEAGQRALFQTAQGTHWSMPPMRRSCSANHFPRPDQAARADREVFRGSRRGSARADGAPLDPFVPAGRVRADVSRQCKAPQQVAVAVHRRHRTWAGGPVSERGSPMDANAAATDPGDPEVIKHYHAHVYYDPASSRERAARLRETRGGDVSRRRRWAAGNDELVGPAICDRCIRSRFPARVAGVVPAVADAQPGTT